MIEGNRQNFLESVPEEALAVVENKLGGEAEQLSTETQEQKEAEQERQLILAERIAEFEKEVQNREIKQEEALVQLEFLQGELDGKQSKTLGKVLEFVSIQRLKKQIDIQTQDVEQMKQDWQKVHELLRDLEDEANDQSTLEGIEASIKSFEDKVSEAVQEYFEDKETRDIGNVCAEHNAVFVHTIEPSSDRMGQTTALRNKGEGIDFAQKLKMVMGLQPDISTSSLRLAQDEDEFKDKTYASLFGVVLKEGSVKQASSGDSGSVTVGKERIQRTGNAGEGIDIKTDIDEAVTSNKKSGGYNEIIVAKPEVAGLFITDDSKTGTGKVSSGYQYKDEVFGVARELGMPIYVRDASTNRFYVAEEDEQGELSYGKEVTREDIMNTDFSFSDEQRGEVREEIFEDCPFNLNMEEQRAADEYETGKEKFSGLIKNPPEYGDYRAGSLPSAEEIKSPEDFINAVKVYFEEQLLKGVKNIKESEDELRDAEDLIARINARVEKGETADPHSVEMANDKKASAINNLDIRRKSTEINFMKTSFTITGAVGGALEAGRPDLADQFLDIIQKIDEVAKELDFSSLIISENHDEMLDRRGVRDGKFRISPEELDHIEAKD